jgi:hypothetical protein
MAELLASMVSEFRGSVPDVPFAPGVDVDGLKADDPNPMFVTLPIVKVGATSQNGLKWERPDAEHLVTEINERRVEGNLGHTPIEKRSTEYKLPVIRWVGSMLDGDTVWAKGYIPQYATDMREHIRLAKRANAKVGTSVYGRRGKLGLRDMRLEDIDFGHDGRVSLEEAAAIPHITSEITSNAGGSMEPNESLVAELRQDRDKQRELVSELQGQVREANQKVKDAETTIARYNVIAEMAKVAGESDVKAWIDGLVAELALVKKRQNKADIERIVVEMVKVEDLRPVVSEMVGEANGEAAIRKAVETVLEKDWYKSAASKLVSEQSGPNAFRSGGSATKLEDLKARYAEAAKADAAKRGITVPEVL